MSEFRHPPYRFGPFELDAGSLTLRARGRAVDLPRKSVETLTVLVARSGQVVSKAELMVALWPDGFVEEANLTQHVYVLRRVLRAHGMPDAIETHPRRGYCFRPPTSVLPSQRGLAWRGLRSAVAAAVLIVAVSADAVVAPRNANDPQVAQTYALGKYFWNLRSMDGMSRSVGYFRKVIAQVPERAAGYAALADAYTELADFEQPCAACAGWRREAEWNAARALALEPASADAHVAVGMVARVFCNDDYRAAREFRTALGIDPRNALAHQWYGNLLVAQGAFGAGHRELELAAGIEPISTGTYAWLARASYYEGHNAEAERYALEALALQPTRLETTALLGSIEVARGHFAQALRAYDTVERLGAAADAEVLRSSVYAAMGRRREALAMLERVRYSADRSPYASRDLVLAYVVAGNTSAALTQLARIRFQTRLDRTLFALDPRVRTLSTAILRRPA